MLFLKHAVLKELLLKNARYFILDSTVYVYFWIAATSRKVKGYHEKHRNL